MQSGWSENMSPDRQKAMEELGRGRELTNQLRDLLISKSSVGDEGLVGISSEDLVMKILNSFANTLSILRNSGDDDDFDEDEVSQNPNNNNMSWGEDGRKSEDSGESTTSKQKNRRGCYKRRKCAESWTKDSQGLIDDGYAWRKYGQKTILKAKHPRNYYRCTHKADQGCLATKQVQQINEDDPPKYRTIYFGRHTCQNPVKASSHQLILHQHQDSTSNDDSSILLSFANNNVDLSTISNNKHVVVDDHDPFFTSFPSYSSPSVVVKQESKEDIDQMPISDITTNYNPSSSSEYLMSHELTTFESSSAQMTAVLSSAESIDLDDLLQF